MMIAKNKIITVFIVAMLVIPFVAVLAYGDTIIKEQFDYDPGLITGRNGGIGFGGAWSFSKSHGQDYKTGITVYSNGTGTTLNEDTGLSFSTLPVAGSALSRYGSAGRAEANRTISVASQTALTADNTTIWFSVLISPPSAHRYASFLFGTESLGHSDLGDLKAVGEGFGFTLTAVGGGDGGGAINALAFDGSIDPIIAAGTFTAVIQPGGTHYDPVMIVGKINWKPNGTPDELYLFSVSDLTIEPAEVDAFASIINLDLDQSGFDILSVCDTNSAIFDEIRFGGTFVSVGGIDPDAPTVDACPDKIAWSNVAVPLDGTVVNNDSQVPQRSLNYAWTADDESLADTNLTIVITNANQEDASVKITKALPTGDATVVTMTLAATLQGVGTVEDSMMIDVYDDACLAAKASGIVSDATDVNDDCITDLEDLAEMFIEWLVSYQITEPMQKP